MNIDIFNKALLPLAITLALGSSAASAAVLVQCPGDKDGSAIIGDAGGETANPDIKCMHLTAGDGFTTMADGTTRYMFGFADVTGLPTKTPTQKNNLIQAGVLAHEWPGPTIELEQGQEFYLSLTNVGMMMRPDLFDPHTVHFHGFPQSSTVFDGLPESGLSIGMGATLTYYYKLNDPGTYMYHCHVEATEHMQMGMLGNLYIKAAQNKTGCEDLSCAATTGTAGYAYNDGDGSTYYDVDYPIQLGSFDGAFHDASENTQPLPFALMEDNYPMINGRGYPDTVDMKTDGEASIYDPTGALDPFPVPDGFNNTYVHTGQPVSSLITANAGEKVLLRISNLAITRFYTLQSLGIPMQVVGKDAKLLRTVDGETNLYYNTNSVTIGGGESFDVILDTTNVAAGTYYLYTANLNYLSNDTEEFGGMMTEIVIN
ncbi:MAG: FtsP/CotA-like multicopper oxidase with cupredoxin domain [Desulforhopalus sp.]|jgi:FtsP/CotA-like multicopper oxidase with cupredoxin domain